MNATIQSPSLRVTVSDIGAQLMSIVDANGVERLWQRDPAYWAGSAPILFPIAGGLKNDCYILHGTTYPMPKHGFVRGLVWELEKADDTSLTYLTCQKHEGFPFAYELRATYTLSGNRLQVSYTVTNKDTRAFYYGIGSHEGYATPEGIEDYELVFECPETFDNYVLHGNLIAKEPVHMGSGNVLALKYDYFTVDALVFLTLKSRSVSLKSRSHRRGIRVDYPGHNVLMLWTRPDAGYLCIEPWLNAPDFEDCDMHIDHKPGCVRLVPGETREHTHIITVE